MELVEEANDNAIEIFELELRVENQTPVYEIKGRRNADLLFIIPVTMEIISIINAQTGEIIEEKTPFWSFLARLKTDKVLRKEFKYIELFKDIKDETKKQIREERREALRKALEAA